MGHERDKLCAERETREDHGHSEETTRDGEEKTITQEDRLNRDRDEEARTRTRSRTNRTTDTRDKKRARTTREREREVSDPRQKEQQERDESEMRLTKLIVYRSTRWEFVISLMFHPLRDSHQEIFGCNQPDPVIEFVPPLLGTAASRCHPRDVHQRRDKIVITGHCPVCRVNADPGNASDWINEHIAERIEEHVENKTAKQWRGDGGCATARRS